MKPHLLHVICMQWFCLSWKIAKCFYNKNHSALLLRWHQIRQNYNCSAAVTSSYKYPEPFQLKC